MRKKNKFKFINISKSLFFFIQKILRSEVYLINILLPKFLEIETAHPVFFRDRNF